MEPTLPIKQSQHAALWIFIVTTRVTVLIWPIPQRINLPVDDLGFLNGPDIAYSHCFRAPSSSGFPDDFSMIEVCCIVFVYC